MAEYTGKSSTSDLALDPDVTGPGMGAPGKRTMVEQARTGAASQRAEAAGQPGPAERATRGLPRLQLHDVAARRGSDGGAHDADDGAVAEGAGAAHPGAEGHARAAGDASAGSPGERAAVGAGAEAEVPAAAAQQPRMAAVAATTPANHEHGHAQPAASSTPAPAMPAATGASATTTTAPGTAGASSAAAPRAGTATAAGASADPQGPPHDVAATTPAPGTAGGADVAKQHGVADPGKHAQSSKQVHDATKIDHGKLKLPAAAKQTKPLPPAPKVNAATAHQHLTAGTPAHTPPPAPTTTAAGMAGAATASLHAAHAQSSSLLGMAVHFMPPQLPTGAAISPAPGGAPPTAAAGPATAARAEQMRVRAEQAVREFIQRGAQRIQALVSRGTQASTRVQPHVQEAQRAVDHTVARNQATVQQSAAAARAHMQQAHGQTHAQVTAHHATTQAGIRQATTHARATAEADHAQAKQQVQQREQAQAAHIEQIYAQADPRFRAVGPQIGARALAIGEQRKAQYLSQCNGQEDSFWDGPIHDERLKASGDAAVQVGQGYHDKLADEGNKQADAAKPGQANDVAHARQASEQTQRAFDAQHAATQSALDGSEDQALQTAQHTVDGVMQNLEAQLEGALSGLVHQQTQLIHQIVYGGQQHKQGIHEAGQHAVAQVQHSLGQAAEGLRQAVANLHKSLDGQPAPDPIALSAHLHEQAQKIDQSAGKTEQLADEHVGQHGAQLGQHATQASAQLDQTGHAGVQAAAHTGAAHAQHTQQAGQTATRGLTQLATGHQATTTKVASQSTQSFTQQVTAMATMFDQMSAGLSANFEQGIAGLAAGLRDSLAGIHPDIDKYAGEAAGKVQPRWKGWLKILLIIVVVLVVALVIGPAVIGFVGGLAASAIGAGTAASAIGMIVGGAIVGAGAGAVTQMGNNVIDGAPILHDVAHAAINGAITGAIGGAAGAWGGAFTQAGSAFTGAAIRIGGNALGAFAGQVGADVFTGRQINWSQAGMSALMAGGMTAGFEGFGALAQGGAAGRFGAAGRWANRAAGVMQSSEEAGRAAGGRLGNSMGGSKWTPGQAWPTNSIAQNIRGNARPQDVPSGETPGTTSGPRPGANEPVTDTPTSQTPKPATDEPTSQTPKPTADEPATQGPKPTAEEPTSQGPKPTSEEPTTQGPKPTTDEPTTQGPKPTTDEPTPQGPKPTEEPATPKPAEGETPVDPEAQAQAARQAKTDEQLAKALKDRGLNDEMFNDMDPQTRQKVNTALSQDPIAKASPEVQKAAQDWAAEGANGNPREFANRYEYARAKFNEARAQAAEDLAGTPGAKAKAAQTASNEITPEKLNAALKADNETAQGLGKGQNLGSGELPENPTPQEVAQGVQKLDRVGYESDTAESYHAVKHQPEMPSPPRSPNQVENANAYAMDTIKTGSVVDATRPPAGGSTRVIIQKTYPSAAGGEPQVMEAIVYVDPNGKVTLASYGRAKAISAGKSGK
jgi:hypothetical protein